MLGVILELDFVSYTSISFFKKLFFTGKISLSVLEKHGYLNSSANKNYNVSLQKHKNYFSLAK